MSAPPASARPMTPAQRRWLAALAEYHQADRIPSSTRARPVNWSVSGRGPCRRRPGASWETSNHTPSEGGFTVNDTSDDRGAQQAEARFVPDGEPSDIRFVISEFATATQALGALEDLHRWAEKRDKEGWSAWRLPAEDGEGRIIAVAMFPEAGLDAPIIRRFKRRGGSPTDLPEDIKVQLINRMLKQAASGSSAANWGVQEQLEPPPPDGPRPIELP